MSQTNMNIRIDLNLKNQFEKFCNETGLDITTAITLYIKKVVNEQRIPFSIDFDPYYSKSNIKYLTKVINEINIGKATLVEHDLIEDEI